MDSNNETPSNVLSLADYRQAQDQSKSTQCSQVKKLEDMSQDELRALFGVAIHYENEEIDDIFSGPLFSPEMKRKVDRCIKLQIWNVRSKLLEIEKSQSSAHIESDVSPLNWFSVWMKEGE